MNINKIHHWMHLLYRRGGICLIISKLMYRYVRIIYSADIPYQLDLEGVYLGHQGFGIVINPKSIIGKGTYVHCSVCIGAINSENACPIIGENCLIGSHAIVLGGITIGNNVKIGAGAVVVSDVPDNVTVVGVPAKIV